MHAVARALQAQGIAAYALDMRGHGASGAHGDVAYVGQLDDDLADFMAPLRAQFPAARISLIGHSSGGGFALRTAGGANHDLFDNYVLLAPFLHSDAPTTRPNAGGWVNVAVPRIVGLSLLDKLGVHWFEHLPVLMFALPPEAAANHTVSYSYRLQLSYRPHADYLADVRGITRPVWLLVGAADELFKAEQYGPLLEPLQPMLKVQVLLGVNHLGAVVDPRALNAVLGLVSGAAPGP
jgi:alpha-beta hydrolase superfamily lysophospholipase